MIYQISFNHNGLIKRVNFAAENISQAHELASAITGGSYVLVVIDGGM